MAWIVAPACTSLLNQATFCCPNRSKKSDGTKGDAAHAARASDHNPADIDGNPNTPAVVMACDLTHDPAHGLDAHAWVRWMVKTDEHRWKYCISNGQIISRDRIHEGWRKYTGSNMHNKHCHVSMLRDHWQDTSNWFDGYFGPSQGWNDKAATAGAYNENGILIDVGRETFDMLGLPWFMQYGQGIARVWGPYVTMMKSYEHYQQAARQATQVGASATPLQVDAATWQRQVENSIVTNP